MSKVIPFQSKAEREAKQQFTKAKTDPYGVWYEEGFVWVRLEGVIRMKLTPENAIEWARIVRENALEAMKARGK